MARPRGRNYAERLKAYKDQQCQKDKLIRKHCADRWQASWKSYQEAHDRNLTVAQTALLSKKQRLDIHIVLAKAESALATQIRTEKIGFAQFLHQSRVPTVDSPACDCGWHSQTAKHVIMYCRLRPHRRRVLEEAGTTDYRRLISTPKGLRVVTKWVMKSGLLSQFSLAAEQLYQ